MASSSDEEEDYTNKTREEIEEEQNFLSEIASFLDEIGKPILKKFPPKITGTRINFTTLYRLVTGYGGYFSCNEMRLWPDILEVLEIPCPVLKNCIQTLCMHYRRYLLDYEKVYFHGRPLSSVLSTIPYDPDDRPMKKPTLPLPQARAGDVDMDDDAKIDDIMMEEDNEQQASSKIKPKTSTSNGGGIVSSSTISGNSTSSVSSAITTTTAAAANTATPSTPSLLLNKSSISLRSHQQHPPKLSTTPSSSSTTTTTTTPSSIVGTLGRIFHPSQQQNLSSSTIRMEYPFYKRKRNFNNLQELISIRKLTCCIEARHYLDVHQTRQTLLQLHAYLVQRPWFCMDNIDRLGLDFLMDLLLEFHEKFCFQDPKLSSLNIHTKEEILKGENYLLALQCLTVMSALVWNDEASTSTAITGQQYKGIALKILLSNNQKLLTLLTEILMRKPPELIPREYTERILEIFLNLSKSIRPPPESLIRLLMRMCFVNGQYTLASLETLIFMFSSSDKAVIEQYQKSLSSKKDIRKLWQVACEDDDVEVCELSLQLLVSVLKHFSEEYKKEVIGCNDILIEKIIFRLLEEFDDNTSMMLAMVLLDLECCITKEWMKAYEKPLSLLTFKKSTNTILPVVLDRFYF